MARKPGTRTVGEFVLFDVYYEDGTQRSNRRVPASALGGLDGDEPAKAIIAEQDAEIAEKSGQPRGPIKIDPPRRRARAALAAEVAARGAAVAAAARKAARRSRSRSSARFASYCTFAVSSGVSGGDGKSRCRSSAAMSEA